MPDHTLTIRTTASAGDESLSGLTGGRSVRPLRIRRYQLLHQSGQVGPARLLLRQRSDRWVEAV
jgi:hypothetical protein